MTQTIVLRSCGIKATDSTGEGRNLIIAVPTAYN